MKQLLPLTLICALLLGACMLPTPEPTPTTPPEVTEDAPTPTAPEPTSAPPTESPAEPTAKPTLAQPTQRPKPEHSVFLISWDAGRADFLYDLMADGTLPHFAELAEGGLRAEYAQTIDPSLTAAAHNSISTGSYPARTGIVSNSFHNLNDSFYWYRRGFDELLDQAEPVWVTASKAGLTTASVFFVGGTPGHPGQTADYTIGYGISDAYSKQHTIDLLPVEDNWEGELPKSFSPPYEGEITIREVSRVHLYALDSSDDGQANYDRVLMNIERAWDENLPNLGVGEWGPLVLMPRIYAGADFLIQEIAQESETPTQLTFFQGAVHHNTAAPRELMEGLNEEFGFFPSGPDYYALEHGWISPEDNLVLLERASLWMAQVAAWVQESYQPDLLFTWQDGFDAAGHAFFMFDEHQLNYSPENAELYRSYYLQAAGIADRALEIMLDSIELERTTVMMVGDHGMAPIHSRVYVNTILEQAGLLTLDKKDYVVVNKTKAFAVASGGGAHIYINLEGHEKDGYVSEEEYAQIQDQIVEAFTSLTDPETGEPVFQRVLRQDELGALHLDHVNSGDVFVQANLGYHLDGWRGKNQVFEQADFYGQHGYNSSLPEMYALFIAAGKGVPSTGETIPPVHIVDYAPTIAALLGFDPASTVDGSPIPALIP